MWNTYSLMSRGSHIAGDTKQNAWNREHDVFNIYIGESRYYGGEKRKKSVEGGRYVYKDRGNLG